MPGVTRSQKLKELAESSFSHPTPQLESEFKEGEKDMATNPPNPPENDARLEGVVYKNLNDRRPIREFANLGHPGHRFGYIAQGGENPNLTQTLIHLLGQSQFGGGGH